MKWDPETMKHRVFYMSEEAYEWFKKEYARLYVYFVYVLTAPNGKINIGYGKGDPEKRWANGNGYNHNSTLKAAIKECGWENYARETGKAVKRESVSLKCESASPENWFGSYSRLSGN